MIEVMIQSGESVPADRLASTGLLSFYDRLRRQVTTAVERRSGRSGRRAAEILLVAPDLFILTVRLAMDRQVPAAARRLIVGALVYFVTPIDLLPEAVVGPAGYVEDVVLLAALLSVVLGPELEPMAERYWNGSRRLRTVLAEVAEVAHNTLGGNLYGRLQRLLARRGIELR